jgi:hypothetical protein
MKRFTPAIDEWNGILNRGKLSGSIIRSLMSAGPNMSVVVL